MKKSRLGFISGAFLLLIAVVISSVRLTSRIDSYPFFSGGNNLTTDEQNADDMVRVKRVIDGDTFETENGQKVRMIGIDAPESVHPDKEKNTEFGKEASKFLKELLEGKSVRLEKDVSETDRYGRLLRYVYLADGTFVNELIVKEGYARVSTYPPDVKFADVFVEAERYARENNKGLWAFDEKTPPEPGVDSEEGYLYAGSKNSGKYHKLSCRYVKEISDENLVRFKDKSSAEAAGFVPCKVCNP